MVHLKDSMECLQILIEKQLMMKFHQITHHHQRGHELDLYVETKCHMEFGFLSKFLSIHIEPQPKFLTPTGSPALNKVLLYISQVLVE